MRIYTKDYIMNNKATFGSFLSIGDIVQVLNETDSKASHSIIVSEKTNNTTINYCAHSNNALNQNIFNFIDGQPETRWIVAIKIRN